MGILPDNIRSIDQMQVPEQIQTIHGYIKYMYEQLEFWSGSKDKLINNISSDIGSVAEALGGVAEAMEPIISYMAGTNRWVYDGPLFQGVGSSVYGNGHADITREIDGIYRIDFNLYITSTDSTADFYNFGIDSQFFTGLLGKTLTPIKLRGQWSRYRGDDYNIDTGFMLYGTTFDTVMDRFWLPTRYYDPSNPTAYGAWGVAWYPINTVLIGTCYGR